jgi:hypothetical protein
MPFGEHRAPTQAEIGRWSPEERARVARALDEMVDRPRPTHTLRRRRTLILAITAGGVVALLGWTAYLTATLPDGISVGAWRTAWVGFDAVLIAVLGTSAWLVWNRRQLAVTGLTIAASLLVIDAWLDVCLSWSTPEQWSAIASAVFVEIPIALVLGITVARVLGQSFAVVQQLRGEGASKIPLWRQPVVMLPPQTHGPDPGVSASDG